MARHLSAKQIKAGFGGPRRKAALKSNRARPKKKSNASSHRPRSKPKAKQNSAHSAKQRFFRPSKPRAKTKKNPMVWSLLPAGNPAKRSNMAAHKKSKKKAARSNAGRPRRKTNMTHHRRRTHRNPSIGSPMTYVEGGAGVLVGVFATRSLPQMFAASANTGPTGYAMNAAVAIGLGILSHMLMPKRPVFTAALVAGGMASLLSRIIQDYTPYGAQFSSLSGLRGFGDYQITNNWTNPPRLQSPDSAMYRVPPMAAPVAMAGVSGYGGDGYANCG